MKIIVFGLLTLFCLPVMAQQTIEKHTLMPVPAKINFDSGRLVVDSTFTIAIKGESDPRLQAAVTRALTRLQGRTGSDLRQIADANTAKLIIQRQNPGQSIPSLNEDEKYSLTVSPAQAELSATTTVGVIRGLETFLQLLTANKDGYSIPVVKIEDQPRFPWRGLLIDAGRHFEPVEVIKRNLDAMAAVKLNVLHWHLTEDQGFRVESKKYPKLHELGSDGQYYSQEQIREVIAYAKDRGIRVVPEFDIPGHTTAWFVGYPELASGPGPYQIERKWGVMKPAMNPTDENVYKFLDGFLGEMAGLFPDAYLHIGGDEVEGHQWKENEKIQAWMKSKNIADNKALQAYFNGRVAKILKKYGKKMVGWDEILHPDLPNDIVVHSWRGIASLAEGAKKGYAGILSNGFYIDHVQPAARHYVVDPIAANTDLTPEQQKKILGGEAAMWGEYVTSETIDSRIWPRSAAIAERLWSPREINDVNDMYRRLAGVSVQLEDTGIQHIKQQDAMLRRLAHGENIDSLRTLVGVIEPIKFLDRYNWRKYTQQTPMTRLVDAARPDSLIARNFGIAVDTLLADAPNFTRKREPLQRAFVQWFNASNFLREIIDESPILQEAEPLRNNLAELAQLGNETLDYLAHQKIPTEDWRKEKLALLDQIAKPKAEVEFVVVNALRQLVIAAADQEQLKNLSPPEWNRKVKEASVPKRPERR